MIKKAGLLFLGIFLVGIVFTSAGWTGTGTEFVSLGAEDFQEVDDLDYVEDVSIDIQPYLWILVALVLLVVLWIVFKNKKISSKKKVVSKKKVSKKRKVKRK